jgi:hypothetical protein
MDDRRPGGAADTRPLLLLATRQQDHHRPSRLLLVISPPTRKTVMMVVVLEATPLTLVWRPSIAALLQHCASADTKTLPPLPPMKCTVVADFMSLSLLRMPKNAGSAPCGAITAGQGHRHHL